MEKMFSQLYGRTRAQTLGGLNTRLGLRLIRSLEPWGMVV